MKIDLGDIICFKAMCIMYDKNANDYHFKILEINKPFTIKNSKKVFKVEKSAKFKANCIFVENNNYIFNLVCHNSEPIEINYSDIQKKFFRKSKIYQLKYFCKELTQRCLTPKNKKRT